MPSLALNLEGVEILCLTWTPHIKYIAGKALCAVSVVRVLSRVSWVVSPCLLLSVYRGLVRAYLEWDSPLFRSPGDAALRILDRVQYEVLRAVLGCMRTSRIAIFLSEANEIPPVLHRSNCGGCW